MTEGFGIKFVSLTVGNSAWTQAYNMLIFVIFILCSRVESTSFVERTYMCLWICLKLGCIDMLNHAKQFLYMVKRFWEWKYMYLNNISLMFILSYQIKQWLLTKATSAGDIMVIKCRHSPYCLFSWRTTQAFSFLVSDWLASLAKAFTISVASLWNSARCHTAVKSALQLNFLTSQFLTFKFLMIVEQIA